MHRPVRVFLLACALVCVGAAHLAVYDTARAQALRPEVFADDAAISKIVQPGGRVRFALVGDDAAPGTNLSLALTPWDCDDPEGASVRFHDDFSSNATSATTTLQEGRAIVMLDAGDLPIGAVCRGVLRATVDGEDAV